MLDRRTFLASLALSRALPFPASAADLTQALGALEKRARGRLGVAAWDLETGRRFAWRGRERFRMCSTFKLLLAARTLSRVDEGRERLDRVIPFGREILLGNSPVTSAHVGDGLSVAELCAAAITVSDNGAANTLLAALGGPEAMTAYWRSIGDKITRLDDIELKLNIPDGEHNTTTPFAMLSNLKTLLLGDALSPASRARLLGWMRASTTGVNRLRAGLPAAWQWADKTGTSAERYGMVNDIGIATPPGRSPILIAAYTAHANEKVLADAGAIVARAFA